MTQGGFLGERRRNCKETAAAHTRLTAGQERSSWDTEYLENDQAFPPAHMPEQDRLLGLRRPRCLTHTPLTQHHVRGHVRASRIPALQNFIFQVTTAVASMLSVHLRLSALLNLGQGVAFFLQCAEVGSGECRDSSLVKLLRLNGPWDVSPRMRHPCQPPLAQRASQKRRHGKECKELLRVGGLSSARDIWPSNSGTHSNKTYTRPSWSPLQYGLRKEAQEAPSLQENYWSSMDVGGGGVILLLQACGLLWQNAQAQVAGPMLMCVWAALKI